MNTGHVPGLMARWKLIGLSLILFLLPYSYKVASIITGLLFIALVFEAINKRRMLPFYQSAAFWIPVSFIVVPCIWLVNTGDFPSAWAIIERLVSFVVFPLFFVCSKLSEKEFYQLKKWFVLSLLFMICLLESRLLWLLLNSTEHDFGRYFFSYYYTYENLTTPFLAQPVYIGTYVVLSNIFCTTLAIQVKSSRWMYVLAVAINTFFLFQLGARSSLILNLIVLVFYIGYVFYVRKRAALGLFLIIALLSSFLILYRYSGFTRLRMGFVISELSASDLVSTDPKSRLLIWPCAVEIIKENVLFGVGTGDAENLLVEKYQEHELWDLFHAGLNAHNQYLTLMMRHGLFGVLLILLNVALPLYVYWRYGEVEAWLFTFLIAGFFLTENVLGKAHGVIFVALFHSYFLARVFNRAKHEGTRIWH